MSNGLPRSLPPPQTRRRPVLAVGKTAGDRATTTNNLQTAADEARTEPTHVPRQNRAGALYVTTADRLVVSSSGKAMHTGFYRCPSCSCLHAWRSHEPADRLNRRTACSRRWIVLLVGDAT